MIISLLLNVLIAIVGIILSWLPTVTTIPPIFGFDIDSTLVTAMGYFNGVTSLFWPLAIILQGFLVLMGYYLLKITLIFFLGSRAPANN